MPASTTNQASQTVIGASGAVYVALSSATVTAPTDESTALDSDLIELGFISEEGIIVRDSKEVGELKAWQTPYPIRRFVTGRIFEVEFKLEQWNWETLAFAMGGGTLTEPSPGKYKFVPPDADDLDTRSMVVQWVDGTKDYRLWIPSGLVTDAVEFNVKRDDAAMFPIKFGAIFNGTDPTYTLFTDDPAFEVA